MYTKTHLQNSMLLVSTIVCTFAWQASHYITKQGERCGSYKSQQQATVRVVRRYLNLQIAGVSVREADSAYKHAVGITSSP